MEWAAESIRHSFWARVYYQQQRDAGKAHQAAVRALAFKWIRILFRCWQERTPYAMLSRGVAGFIGSTLVITLPGSTRGAIETMDALFPYIIHIFRVAEGMRHD